MLIERDNTLVLRPLPDDPLAAAIGSLKSGGLTTDEIRAEMREEEAEIEERKYGR